MSANKFYTETEWNKMMQMRYEGKSFAEIAEAVGRLESAVTKRFDYKNKEYKEFKIKMLQKTPVTTIPPKEKTLADFSPRDIIKHLHNLGYRIENNQLVYYSKQYIKLNDIING